jgi:hypothetical protein
MDRRTNTIELMRDLSGHVCMDIILEHASNIVRKIHLAL